MEYQYGVRPHTQQNVNHLAWHETLEIHELTALQSIGLMKLKTAIGKVNDPNLRSLYEESIAQLQHNLQELLQFYPMAPVGPDDGYREQLDSAFYSGDLLAFSKTAVRSYAIAITETATPALRTVLNRQLQAAIQSHAKVFYYMYRHGYYPAYNLQQLLENDIKLARKAMRL